MSHPLTWQAYLDPADEGGGIGPLEVVAIVIVIALVVGLALGIAAAIKYLRKP